MDTAISIFLIVFSLLLIVILVGTNLVWAISCCGNDFISIDAGRNSYSFDVDFVVTHGDPFPGTDVSVNKDAAQETAHAKIGQRISADIAVSPQNGHVDSAHMFLTKDKIKISSHSIKFGKIIKFQLNDLCCDVIHGDIPKIKKGTYSLVVQVKNNDELERYYVDKIKISK